MAGEKIPTLVLKQLALKQLDQTIMADHGMVIESIMENTGLDHCALSKIKYRRPWDIAWGDISKGNVCVVGDALHPSLPYLGQGGGTAMEDGLVLARSLAQAMSQKDGILGREYCWDEFCYKKVECALKKYSEERRWRIVEVVVVALVTGYVQNHTGPVITFLRENFLNKFWSKIVPNVSDFDCGRLSISSA